MRTLPKSIVFITGAFLSSDCWEEWRSFFESNGYKCIAPSWPNKETSPEHLRSNHPNPRIAVTRLRTLIDHYESIINALPEKPILIGHSLGGLVVQLLLQRELGAAGIAIHSFPPKGMGKELAFLKAISHPMGFFTSTSKTYLISFKIWKRRIANGMTRDQQKQLYYELAIPESKWVIRDSFKSVAKINFGYSHPPLLLTSGGKDRMIPPSMNYRNYEKYRQGASIIAYKEFKERNHLVFGHAAWREDADFILDWLEGLFS